MEQIFPSLLMNGYDLLLERTLSLWLFIAFLSKNNLNSSNSIEKFGEKNKSIDVRTFLPESLNYPIPSSLLQSLLNIYP